MLPRISYKYLMIHEAAIMFERIGFHITGEVVLGKIVLGSLVLP